MSKTAKTPKPSRPISTVSILVNGTDRIGYAAQVPSIAAYPIEIAGEVYDLVLWAHGPDADNLVPHLVAQAMIWRPQGGKGS